MGTRPDPTAVETTQLPSAGKVYVGIVVGAGAFAIALSLTELGTGSIPSHWVILAALTLLGGVFGIRIPSLHATLFVSETFIFALVVLFGPAPAIATVAVDRLVASIRVRNQTVCRTLFNIAEPAVSVWFSATVFYGLSGVEPLLGRGVPLSTLFLPLVVLVTAYFALNSLLTAVAVRFETGTPVWDSLRSNRPHVVLNYLVSVCLFVFIVENVGSSQNLSVSGFGTVLALLALLVLLYCSSKTHIAQVEGANRRLAELNELHLSTVETLAAAIDVKDQVTSGHIRRVQQSALRLAREPWCQ